MFLTSLRMRGFKSFADTTSLDVEPGITVIVGPNGSGKSNVVDALSWVLGTASPSKVRGGTMTDVLFAGSPDRGAAPTARVEITIDNSAGVLGADGLGTSGSAQQFSEVSVAREIDRDGSGTYRINGEVVRALDVQELLSDTGLGRELHTIIGQGQLDEILNARPEERRRYIEEAAGILKHRRRRERAVRKLEQVDEHVEQLSLVLNELSRQLKPLKRQAEQADRHKSLQADLRASRVELAAVDLSGLLEARAEHADSDGAAQTREGEARAAVASLRAGVEAGEADVAALGPRAEDAGARWHRLQALRERWRGTAELVDARRRHLTEHVEEPLAGRPPVELRAAAERADASRAELATQLEGLEAGLEDASEHRRTVEVRRREHELARAAAARQRALARERHVRWEGHVAALAGSVQAAEASLVRAETQLAEIDARRSELDAAVGSIDDDRTQLDDELSRAQRALDEHNASVTDAQATLDDLVDEERRLEASRTGLVARAEALRAAVAEQAGGAQAIAGADQLGMWGVVAEHVRVDDDAGAAVAAVLGRLGQAAVAPDVATAEQAVAWLRDGDHGSVTVLAAEERAGDDGGPGPEASDDLMVAQLGEAGARPVASLLTPAATPQAPRVVAALGRAVASAWVVDDWHDAVRLHVAHPHLTVATTAGDVAGPRGFVAATTGVTSAVLAATAADEAEAGARDLASAIDDVTERLAGARRQLVDAREAQLAAADARHRAAADVAGARDRAERLAADHATVRRQYDVLSSHRVEITSSLDTDRSGLAELRGQGPPVIDIGDDVDLDDHSTAELDEALGVARERELDARVDVERVREQIRALTDQARELRAEADEVEAALAAAAARRERRRSDIAVCNDLAVVCTVALDAMGVTLREAAEAREAASSELAAQRRMRDEARSALRQAEASLSDVRDLRHQAELARADIDHRIEAIAQQLRNDFALGVEDAMAAHPDVGEVDRAMLVERVDTLQRRVGLLGQINPLALAEFEALEQRHRFLADQVDDLMSSRADLHEVIDNVDGRIREVFTDAWEDIAAAFAQIFQVVFPGGYGRLRLVGDDDPLTAGIEVEARPPGKKITRLSLLSGGERSLTVLAFVFAIFMARPSPFYVLDEVDAALDDVNLRRLLEVIESFRGSSQIIMVTHQKRSMEIADVLYGITMGPDAVTKVVAQRLDELEASGVLAAAG